MNTAVAVTGIIGKTAVILAGIWAGRGFLIALVPQLRIAAPKDTPKTAAEPSPAAALDGQKQAVSQ